MLGGDDIRSVARSVVDHDGPVPLGKCVEHGRDRRGLVEHGQNDVDRCCVTGDPEIVRSVGKPGTRTAVALFAVGALTVAFGLIYRAAGGGLGTSLPPFFAFWDPHVDTYALIGLPVVAISAVAAVAAAARPRQHRRVRRRGLRDRARGSPRPLADPRRRRRLVRGLRHRSRGRQRVPAGAAVAALARAACVPRPLRRAVADAADPPVGPSPGNARPARPDRHRLGQGVRRARHPRRSRRRAADLRARPPRRPRGGTRARGRGPDRLLAGGAALRRPLDRRAVRDPRPDRRLPAGRRADRLVAARRRRARRSPPSSPGRCSRSARSPPSSSCCGAGSARRSGCRSSSASC